MYGRSKVGPLTCHTLCRLSDIQFHSVKVSKQDTQLNIDSLCVHTFFLLGDLRHNTRTENFLGPFILTYTTKSIDERSQMTLKKLQPNYIEDFRRGRISKPALSTTQDVFFLKQKESLSLAEELL